MKKSKLIRALSLVMVLLIAASTLFTASAAEVTKATKKYDIAVVYDNSGSMYTSGNRQRWCRAKYAMEIFASMLDYENGDKLTIYPMWPVTVGDGSPQTLKVEVKCQEDINKIHKMLSMNSTSGVNTPFSPVNDAATALKMNADNSEKWLIVLTDGIFDFEDNSGAYNRFDTSKSVESRLKSIANTGINVQYLGLDIDLDESDRDVYEVLDNEPSEMNDTLYSANATGANLKDSLIDICNKIFQRDILKDSLKQNKLTLEISMSKLIVFVQGESNQSPVLKDSNGNIKPSDMDSGLRQYSDISSDKYQSQAVTDDTLFGQVVTYTDLAKGEYTLEYSGSQDKVQLFYEPNVDLDYILTNSDGEEVTPGSGEDIYPGEYTVKYWVKDVSTGEDVTHSALLGENGVQDLKCVAEIRNGGETREVVIENGTGTVALNQGDELFLNISGTYLGKYTITTRDNKLGHTFIISDFPTQSALTVSLDVEQDANWYYTKEKDSWKPIKAAVLLNGKKLSDEEMKALGTEINISPELPFTYELIPGESAYNIYIAKDVDAKSLETGSYDVTFKTSTTDEFERKIESEEVSASFSIEAYPVILPILAGSLAFLLIVLLILFIMSRKVLPKDLIAERREFKLKGRSAGEGKYSYDRRGKTLQLASPPVPTDLDAECKVTLSLYPVDRRWTPSRKRKIGIRDITGPSMGVVRVKIDGTSYERINGRFCQKLSPEDPIKEESSNPSIKVESKKSSIFECSFTSN